MEKFFAQGTLEPQDILPGLKREIIERKVFPVLCASSALGIGVMRVLDACVALLPSPEGRKAEGDRQGRQAGRPLRQRDGPGRGPGLQDRLGPVRGPHLLPAGPVGALPVRRHLLELHQGRARAVLGPLPAAGQGARQRPRGRAPATSWPSRSSRTRSPATRSRPRTSHIVLPALVGSGGLDRLRHRAQGQGRRGQDRHGPPQADRGGSVARVPARRGDQGVPSRRRLAAPRRDRRRAPEEALRRRGRSSIRRKVPYRETITPQGRGARPAQEADRRPRPVRRLPHPRRAAAARQGLRVRRRHLRRLDPAQLHPGRREGHPGGRGARASSPATRWSTSASPSTTASTTTSTPRSSRSSSPAPSPTRRPWRRPSRRCSSR